MKKILKLFILLALLVMGGKSFAQNKHQYVDLGLPSGTLWATCNVGANYPWEYGNYYAWGETKTKTVYNWSNYKYAKGEIDKLTKYSSDRKYGINGFTDKLTKLQPGDDVATFQWGSGWCMPTKEQWEELNQCTLFSWKELNGVQGMLFIGTNGNQLFLPAAGRYCDEPLYGGLEGTYWSSSLKTDYPDVAWKYSFYWDEYEKKFVHENNNAGRCVGNPVRPVRSAK